MLHSNGSRIGPEVRETESDSMGGGREFKLKGKTWHKKANFGTQTLTDTRWGEGHLDPGPILSARTAGDAVHHRLRNDPTLNGNTANATGFNAETWGAPGTDPHPEKEMSCAIALVRKGQATTQGARLCSGHAAANQFKVNFVFPTRCRLIASLLK